MSDHFISVHFRSWGLTRPLLMGTRSIASPKGFLLLIGEWGAPGHHLVLEAREPSIVLGV
jgi:hypothetical protein